MGYLAVLPATISVTATDQQNHLVSDAQRLGGSQGGASATDLAAPGSGLLAPSDNGGYAHVEGTSFAAPLVTGSILLLQQIYESRFGQLPSVSDLEGWLKAGSDPVQDPATGLTFDRLDVARSAALIPNAPTSSGSSESRATRSAGRDGPSAVATRHARPFRPTPRPRPTHPRPRPPPPVRPEHPPSPSPTRSRRHRPPPPSPPRSRVSTPKPQPAPNPPASPPLRKHPTPRPARPRRRIPRRRRQLRRPTPIRLTSSTAPQTSPLSWRVWGPSQLASPSPAWAKVMAVRAARLARIAALRDAAGAALPARPGRWPAAGAARRSRPGSSRSGGIDPQGVPNPSPASVATVPPIGPAAAFRARRSLRLMARAAARR